MREYYCSKCQERDVVEVTTIEDIPNGKMIRKWLCVSCGDKSEKELCLIDEKLIPWFNHPSYAKRLKSIQPYYDDVLNRKKTFEIRYNDRNYQVGDLLTLQEYVDGELTGRDVVVSVIYMTDYEQKPGYVVLGIEMAVITA